MEQDKLKALCSVYDMKCRRIEVLTQELESLKQETRDLMTQIEKEM